MDKGGHKVIIPKTKDKNLVIIGSSDCEINLNLSGFKVHSRGKKYKLSRMAAQMRPNAVKIRKNR